MKDVYTLHVVERKEQGRASTEIDSGKIKTKLCYIGHQAAVDLRPKLVVSTFSYFFIVPHCVLCIAL